MAPESQHCPTSNGLIKDGRSSLPGLSLSLDRFLLEQEEVTSLQKQLNISIEELMQLLVAPASLLAIAPTSKFTVGCAVLFLCQCDMPRVSAEACLLAQCRCAHAMTGSWCHDLGRPPNLAQQQC